jgi:replicative DNA helicase
MTTLSTLDKYGVDFQSRVIAALLKDREFLLTINDVLNYEYFSNDSHKWIIKEIIKYFNKYNNTPTLDILNIELNKLSNEILQISIREQLKDINVKQKEDISYAKEEFINFCKNQSVKTALLESVDLLNLGDYDSIRQTLNTALKAGQNRNLGLDYNKDIDLRYRDNPRNPIPFPWKAFNNITQGGYGEGDLVLVFGNPKGGKSWAIVAMIGEALKLGKNVVAYALEFGEGYFAKRIDAYLTGIPVDKLDENRTKVEEIMSKLPGQLVIKEYSPKRATLNTIETHLDNLENQFNFKPDVIFIDYLDLLKNRKSRAEKKDDIDDVYTDAKGLAKERKIPIVSPSQANRSGAEKAILESVHIAGSFDKLMIADIVISLARGRKDRLEGTGRWHFMGNRYGQDGVTFYSPSMDTSMGHIVIEENPMNDDDVDNVTKTNKEEMEKADKNYLKKKFFELEGKF